MKPVASGISTAALFALLLGGPPAALAEQLSPAHVASHKLEFSGATVSVQESYARTRWPIAQRTFVLTGANGHTEKLTLHDGGGGAGNSSLNLFVADHGRYLLVSERDCVEFDPVAVKARFCAARPPCDGANASGATYLGRFDWMNGFDPPYGAFRLAFRFLPSQDALESGVCPLAAR